MEIHAGEPGKIEHLPSLDTSDRYWQRPTRIRRREGDDPTERAARLWNSLILSSIHPASWYHIPATPANSTPITLVLSAHPTNYSQRTGTVMQVSLYVPSPALPRPGDNTSNNPSAHLYLYISFSPTHLSSHWRLEVWFCFLAPRRFASRQYLIGNQRPLETTQRAQSEFGRTYSGKNTIKLSY